MTRENKMMNEIKKHKKSDVYLMGQRKYSALIWTIGAGVLSLSLLAAFFGVIQRIGLREVFLIFGVFLARKSYKKAKELYIFRNASIGAALGLDVNPKFIKKILKLDKKIKNLEVKRYWLIDYLTKEGLSELKQKRSKGRRTQQKQRKDKQT